MLCSPEPDNILWCVLHNFAKALPLRAVDGACVPAVLLSSGEGVGCCYFTVCDVIPETVIKQHCCSPCMDIQPHLLGQYDSQSQLEYPMQQQALQASIVNAANGARGPASTVLGVALACRQASRETVRLADRTACVISPQRHHQIPLGNSASTPQKTICLSNTPNSPYISAHLFAQSSFLLDYHHQKPMRLPALGAASSKSCRGFT